jgi:hypothetical protein
MPRPLAKHWRCPKCGYEQHEPIRVSAISHLCPVNNDGSRRIYAKDRNLEPVPDATWPAPDISARGAVQLTLEGAA